MKQKKLFALIAVFNLSTSYANTGSLFSISTSGSNAIISPTIARNYPSIGIKITSGQTISGCTSISNGYCIFQASVSQPKTLPFSGSNSILSGVVCLNGRGPVSCQKFSVSAGIGASYAGGVIACLGGGLNNLIAASSDASSGIIWGGYSLLVGASSDTDGAQNTQTITSSGFVGPYAARLCADSTEGGYTDWFLPAKDQLNCLYQNQAAIGGFTTSPLGSSLYWSSTEDGAITVWAQIFNTGTQGLNFKDNAANVRCVRNFTP
ncbi:MAG: DUF1566 domain-containing protein [Legionellaceae bacterium]|nr:DUF1566 domain-containing protein [Legionellaceae bacterium]